VADFDEQVGDSAAVIDRGYTALQRRHAKGVRSNASGLRSRFMPPTGPVAMRPATGQPQTSEMIARPSVVAIALLAGILAAGHVGKLPPALPSIRAEIGLDIATAGWLASMFSATGALIAIFLGGGVVASATFAVAPSLAPPPAQIGTVNGILVQASNVAQFVGPAALAAIVARSGYWEGAFWPMVGANVLLIGLALRVRRQSST
jgi:nitrate/nitrite transporter NarK